MCEINGKSDTDFGGSIHVSFMSSRSQDCEHSRSIHKFNRSIDTLHKNDLGKKTYKRSQETHQKAFHKPKCDSTKLRNMRMTHLSSSQ